MNWFEQFKKDFGFTSNYQISKKTGITASSLTRLNNSDDWKNVKIGTMILLALSVDKTLDQLVSHLYKNDKKRDAEK
ncbi:XRE family transcriptional regulator [Enterococcus faecalis]|nr:XRE family transcriptional regulator [Enterococcus faecalis]